ncbi:MAG: 4-phosphoerythronate dehydrogenase, partial [Rikenellaceae bacterium]|nr:4-phosphoerythronate dehydrogenase [Rikenellaceae bacterium]
MKISVDKNIPYLENVFPDSVEVEWLAGGEFTAETVRESDALLIRTRTRCDEVLLEGSRVKTIATATIGTDHIDLEYCRQKDIKVISAAGCNARGVKQYVAAALIELERGGVVLEGKTIGVVGVGNVGSQVVQAARAMGLKVLQCDPIRAQRGEMDSHIDIDTLLSASDIVTLHVPLTKTGQWATENMANREFFAKMKSGAIFINSSRGEVVDQEALKDAIRSGKLSHTVLDVWRNEPDIDRELMNMVDIATPHIAGYSKQGKANGSAMCITALSKMFDWGLNEWYPSQVEPNRVDCERLTLGEIRESITKCCDLAGDCQRLRANPEQFESLRNNYDYR